MNFKSKIKYLKSLDPGDVFCTLKRYQNSFCLSCRFIWSLVKINKMLKKQHFINILSTRKTKHGNKSHQSIWFLNFCDKSELFSGSIFYFFDTIPLPAKEADRQALGTTMLESDHGTGRCVGDCFVGLCDVCSAVFYISSVFVFVLVSGAGTFLGQKSRKRSHRAPP